MPGTPFAVRIDGGVLRGHRGGVGEPALLLHGGPGLSDYLEPLAAELDGVLETIRYQQRGLAPSTTQGPYTVETHLADAVAVLDALELESAWAVGHSWGAHLALHLAVVRPGRVRGLVCIDGVGALADGGIQELYARLEERFTRDTGRPAAEIGGLADIWPYYFSDVARAPQMPPLEFSSAVYEDTLASVGRHFEQKTLERGLPSFGAPAAFVHGRDDPLPWEASRDTARLIPRAELAVVERCGHFPWLERPGVVAASVRRLLG